MFTRLFRNGHSQAVRIPAALAYPRSDLELEIERVGDELRIRPAGRQIRGALAMDVALVTNNPADFQTYATLRIENWVE